MSIGFDLGGANCVTAVTRRGVAATSRGNMIDVALDEGSKRSVPPAVGFPLKERTMGHVAKKALKSKFKKTVLDPVQQLGEPQAVHTSSYVPLQQTEFPTTGGSPTWAYKIRYRGEEKLIFPEQAVAIMLKHQLQHVKALNVFSNECCITVPNNFPYAKRLALLKAAEIAGLNCLKVVSNTQCLALDYGLLGGKARTETPFATLFVDAGHSGINIGVAKFYNGGWDIIMVDTFSDLSGSFLEDQLVGLFAKKFQAEHGEDFMESKKPIIKVKEKCIKLLKNLVVNEEASMCLDYLYQDLDFTLRVSRDEVTAVVAERLAKFADYLRGFLDFCIEKLGDTKISVVEIVGGVSRMLQMKQTLLEVCKEKLGITSLSATLNADEAAARGCVLQCATLSPRFNLGIKAKDILPYSILVGAPPIDFDESQWQTWKKLNPLFPSFSELNKEKTIKYKTPRSMKLLLIQQDTRGNQFPIGFATVNPDHVTLKEGEEWNKFQILVSLDHSGLLALRAEVSKSYFEFVDVQKQEEVELTEEEYQEALAKAQDEAREKAEAEAAKRKAEKEAKAKAAAESGDAGDAEEQPEPMDVEEEVVVPEVTVSRKKTITVTEKQKKRKINRIHLDVNFVTLMGMTKECQEFITKQEGEQEKFDAECVRIMETRNNLETYVLNAQGDFAQGGKFWDYMTSDEQQNFMNSIMEMDAWLAEDCFDQTFEVYNGQLEKVQPAGNVFETRSREFSRRETALIAMKKVLMDVEKWLADGCKAPEFEHIEDSLKTELTEKFAEATSWLDERQQIHQTTQKTQDPPYMATEISDKMKEFNTAFQAVKNTPKPEPKKEEKAEEAAAGEDKTGEETQPENKAADAPASEEKAKEDEVMEDAEATA